MCCIAPRACMRWPFRSEPLHTGTGTVCVCDKIFWKERRQLSLPHQGALRLLDSRLCRCAGDRAGTSSCRRASRRRWPRQRTGAPKNRVVRKRALVRASARLRALAGPQALQNHTALPGASAAHQGRCAARPLGRSRSQPPAESPARAREAWCSQQRGVNLQGAPGGTSASAPVHSQPLAEAARLASLSCSQPTQPAALRDAAPSSQSVLLPPAMDLITVPKSTR